MQLKHQFEMEQLEERIKGQYASMEKELKSLKSLVRQLRNTVPANYVHVCGGKGNIQIWACVEEPIYDGLNWHYKFCDDSHARHFIISEGQCIALCGRVPEKGEVITIERDFFYY